MGIRSIADKGRSLALTLIIGPFLSFGVTLLTTVFFADWVNEWDTKNAFPIFIAVLVTFYITKIYMVITKKSEKI